jgi:hypothetical protein
MPNDEKLWTQRDIQTLAKDAALEAIERLGRALPCQVIAVEGSIVTVQFEVLVPYTTPTGTTEYYTLPPLTLPKAESQWLRAPTQVGDFGMTVAAHTFLGGISGLASGVANLGTDYGNLATLVFVPVASTLFPVWANPLQAWVNGPAGAVLSDTLQTASVTVSADLVTIRAGSNVWTFSSAGFTMSTGVVAETHLHSGVTTGGGDSGPPIA